MARDERIENKVTSPRHLLSPRFSTENVQARMDQALEPPVRDLNMWVLGCETIRDCLLAQGQRFRSLTREGAELRHECWF